MKKITIEFEVNDVHDEEYVQMHLKGPKLHSLLFNYLNEVRSGLKYSLPEDLKDKLRNEPLEDKDEFSREEMAIAYYRDILYKMLEEDGIEL